MKLIISPQLVEEMINGFATEGAVLFSIGRDEWTAFGYLLHNALGARWSMPGYARQEGSERKSKDDGTGGNAGQTHARIPGLTPASSPA